MENSISETTGQVLTVVLSGRRHTPYTTRSDFAMCAWVHDEIQVACKAEIAERVGEIAVASIKEVTSIFNFKCPLDGEFNVGDNWADTH